MKIKSDLSIIYFLRLAISFAFLSAVADRFGLWGPAGAEGVVWGNFKNFTAYTAILSPFDLNSSIGFVLISTMAVGATILEVIFGILLLTGVMLEKTALGSGILLLVFGLAMAFFLGIKPTQDYSVFSASAAAFALYSLSRKTAKQ